MISYHVGVVTVVSLGHTLTIISESTYKSKVLQFGNFNAVPMLRDNTVLL